MWLGIKVLLFCMMDWVRGERSLGGTVNTAAVYHMRAAVMGGNVVVMNHPSLKEGGNYFTYLAKRGIITNPIYVTGPDLYEGLNDDMEALERVRMLALEGGGLFFMNTRRARQFCDGRDLISAFGVDDNVLRNADTINDKALDRRYAMNGNLAVDSYAPFIILPRPASATQWDRMIREACSERFAAGDERVIIRPSNLASGVDQGFFRREEMDSQALEALIDSITKRNPPYVLVEQCVPEIVDFSMLFWIDRQGNVRRLAQTVQYTQDGVHRGNAISSNPKDYLPEGVARDAWHRAMQKFEEDAITQLTAYANQGARGPVCLDGIYSRTTHQAYQCEKNGRVTAGLVVEGFRQATQATAAIGKNIYLHTQAKWYEVAELLASYGSSVTIGNPLSTEDQDQPMFTAYIQGASIAECEALHHEVQAHLTRTMQAAVAA